MNIKSLNKIRRSVLGRPFYVEVNYSFNIKRYRINILKIKKWIRYKFGLFMWHLMGV